MTTPRRRNITHPLLSPPIPKKNKMPKNTPPLPWKTRFSMAVVSAVTDACRRSNGTINRRLISFLVPRSSPNPNPVRGARTADVTVDSSRGLWFRLFVPESSSDLRQLPVIIFFHGGGFALLSASSTAYDAVCRRFARKIPAVIVSVDYRLAPEHKFPAAYDDGLAVLRFLDAAPKLDNLGFDFDLGSADLSNCFLIGDSAGGNIAHHVARRWAAAEEKGDWARVRVRGMVAIQPYFGGEERTASEVELEGAPLVSMERTDWLWKAFLPEGADRDHEAANGFGPKWEGAVEKGFPAAMVVMGGWDPLKDWQRRYCEGLRERGKEVKVVEYPNATHAFYVLPELEDSRKVIEEIRGFIGSHSSRD